MAPVKDIYAPKFYSIALDERNGQTTDEVGVIIIYLSEYK